MKSAQLWVLFGLIAMTIVTGARAAALEIAPFAKKLPQGWRELGFGMNEESAKAAVARMKKGPKGLEKSPTTFVYALDLPGKRLVKLSLDPAVVKHYGLNDLDPADPSVHAWFEMGRLVAVSAMSSSKRPILVQRLSEQYGSPPRTMTFDYVDQTVHTTHPPKAVQVDLWKGNNVTAVVFEPTAWGPEQLVISDIANADFLRLGAKKAAR